MQTHQIQISNGRDRVDEIRSELFAFALVIAYLAFSLPALAAGFASTSVGLHATMAVYSLSVVAFGLVAVAAQGIRSARLKEE